MRFNAVAMNRSVTRRHAVTAVLTRHFVADGNPLECKNSNLDKKINRKKSSVLSEDGFSKYKDRKRKNFEDYFLFFPLVSVSSP